MKVKEIIQVKIDVRRVSGEIYDNLTIYKYYDNGFIARKIVEGKEKEYLPFFSSQQSN
jgi:hypothetical protein